MYECSHQICQSGMDRPDKFANPARGHLNRKKTFFPVPIRASLKSCLARRFCPSRSASAWSFSTLRLNLVLTHGIPLAFCDVVSYLLCILSTAIVSVLPDNASLSLGKRLHFRGPTLPVIAVATSEVVPAVLLFVEEVCQVLRFQTNSVPRYQ